MPFLAAGGSVIDNPETWVLVSFLIFCGILVYFGVPKLMGTALDNRAERIRKELDDAKALRDEAQKLLAEYQKKARNAEKEAHDIIANARKEATAMASDARANLEQSLARRTKLAEDKIARAEAQAVSDVKSAAVDAAVKATESVVRSRTTGKSGSAIIDQSIKSLSDRLN